MSLLPTMPIPPNVRRLAVSAAAVSALSACGPGHVPDLPGSGGSTLQGSSQYAQQCSAANPYRGDADTTPRAGSLTIEKQWARAYIDEAYLWYGQVPNITATLPEYSNDTSSGFYASLGSYFRDLTVDALAEDRFSFVYPTKQWEQLSQAGVSLGYGIDFFVGSTTPPREYRAALVDPASPAHAAGVRRGDTVVSVDGVSVDDNTSAGIDTLNAGLAPTVAGSHTFVFSRNGVTRPAVVLAATDFSMNPVPPTDPPAQPTTSPQVFDVNGAKVGYIVFTQHVLIAENRLAAAFQSLQSQGVTDLVLDLRYNRGGYLYIASQVGYMVAGSARTQGKTFERLRYNDKRDAESQSANANMTFTSQKCLPDANFRCTAVSETLPTLNLSRVYVLSGSDTCSASEAIVNGLRGVDVQVILVGGTTCGKPYGFTAKDNCGISYFPIEFQGVNAKGFGDYGNGFAATCAVDDDLDHQLGDPAEGLLAAALNHRASGTCPTSGLAKKTGPAGRLMPRPELGKLLFPGRDAAVR